MEKIKLKRPVLHDGAELAEINIDTGLFTTEYIRKVCVEYNLKLRARKIRAVVSHDHGFAAYLAAKASGLSYELIAGLSAGDFTRICNKTAALIAEAKGGAADG